MMQITLTRPNGESQIAYSRLSNERAAKVALNAIKESATRNGHAVKYDGSTLYVSGIAAYKIEPQN